MVLTHGCARRFGEVFALLSDDEVEALEIFGLAPLSAHARQHIGDFVALSEKSVVLVSSDRGHVGQHGGATPAEMQVPLVVASDGATKL